MTADQPYINFANTDFSYKGQQVFENFSLQIQSNQVVSIIGINGSGKSTFLKLALGLLSPTKGQVNVLGYPAGDFKRKKNIGFAAQDIDFPSGLKVK